METWIPKLRPLQNAIPVNKYTKTRSDSNTEFKQTLLVENKVFLCALAEGSVGVRKLHFSVGRSELPRAGRFMQVIRTGIHLEPKYAFEGPVCKI